MVFGLTLPPGGEEVEVGGNETVATPSTQTPNAKRQRRLTLTAMTGLICTLSEECPKHEPGANVSKVASGSPCPSTVEATSQWVDFGDTAALQENLGDGESSPIKRLKRARASISVTATAAVMAAQAAKTLAGSGGNRDAFGQVLRGDRSSDSSDSTEDEEDFALRVRRAQAFESGAMAVTETGQSSPVQQQGELSPRSKLAFDRGVRAAEVAAKVTATMMLGETTVKGTTNSGVGTQSGANREPFGQRPRGGA